MKKIQIFFKSLFVGQNVLQNIFFLITVHLLYIIIRYLLTIQVDIFTHDILVVRPLVVFVTQVVTFAISV